MKSTKEYGNIHKQMKKDSPPRYVTVEGQIGCAIQKPHIEKTVRKIHRLVAHSTVSKIAQNGLVKGKRSHYSMWPSGEVDGVR
jgi:hypothetical protein